jgi:hypothetical protein
VPTQPPPITPQPPGLLSVLIRALGVVAVVILFIAIIIGVGVFIWWWWEWRGMRGLSPISRAYSRLERYIALLGIRPAAHHTPDERSHQIARVLPKAEPPVSAITRMYTAERYGPGARTPQESELQSEMADEAWSETRTSILQRWLRRLLPWGKK